MYLTGLQACQGLQHVLQLHSAKALLLVSLVMCEARHCTYENLALPSCTALPQA